MCYKVCERVYSKVYWKVCERASLRCNKRCVGGALQYLSIYVMRVTVVGKIILHKNIKHPQFLESFQIMRTFHFFLAFQPAHVQFGDTYDHTNAILQTIFDVDQFTVQCFIIILPYIITKRISQIFYGVWVG